MFKLRKMALLLAVVIAAFTLSFGAAAAQGDDDDATPDASPVASPDVTPDAEPTEDTTVKVLPSTGTGDSGSSMVSYAVIIAGAALVAVAAMGSLRQRAQR